MEAVPRLPMISFETKTSTEVVSFGSKLKQYVANFYHEDPESYNNEIHALEALRAGAVRPAIDISGCQMLKKYYCQLHFLKSRFPMGDGQSCSIYFSWKDNYSNMVCSVADVDFELMNILFDIGAVHSKLGGLDSRVTPEGMKMACTHFQCAAWAFQTVRESYSQMVGLVLAPEVIYFMHLTCLAQAQECILEKSMMDNRKATIIAKVAVQVVDYYKQALSILSGTEDGSLSDLLGSKTNKEWIRYLNFKVLYHKAICLLYLGQQAEEQQKMGERVAYYQSAADILQEASKKGSKLPHQQEINEALAFATDVIEGKKKAAKNENEFIYHEEVPDKDALPEVKGASLVKGIPFSVNDLDVSGQDIFSRLIPMEAHEASSLYSEKKANLLRQLGEAVENKDRELVEFMSSLQLDGLSQMRQAHGLTQDLVDRAAAMSAKPTAIQNLVVVMSELSSLYHDVEAMLLEIDGFIKEEERKEAEYQAEMGKRPPSIIVTDLSREYTKYHEAHSKACESNQNLHKAMTTHSANLKILSLPLADLKNQIPSIEFPNPNINQEIVNKMEKLIGKIDEMKKQRAMLWAQFHDAVKNDDITSRLVTCSQMTKEQLFEQELQKHHSQAALIEQNMTAQDNILKTLVDAYASFTETRRYIQDIINKRNNMLTALYNSYDTYDDLLAKANKGLDFYHKLETNVAKLLQRIKSTCKVQDEERDQILAKQVKQIKPVPISGAPKLKDYLDAKAKNNSESKKVDSSNAVVAAPVLISAMSEQSWPPGIRPTPVGSEMTNNDIPYGVEQSNYADYSYASNYNPYYNSLYATASTTLPQVTPTYSSNSDYNYISYDNNMEQNLNERMSNLMTNKVSAVENQNYLENQNYVHPNISQHHYAYMQKDPQIQVQPNPITTKNLPVYSNPHSPYVSEHYNPANYVDHNPTSIQNYIKQNPVSISLPNTSLQQYYQPTFSYTPSDVYVQSTPSTNTYSSYSYSPLSSVAQGPNYTMQQTAQPNYYVDSTAYTNPTMTSNYDTTSHPGANAYPYTVSPPDIYNQESVGTASVIYSSSTTPTQTTFPIANPRHYDEYHNNYQQYTTCISSTTPFDSNNPVGTYQSYQIQPTEPLQNYDSGKNSTVVYSTSTVAPINHNYSVPEGPPGSTPTISTNLAINVQTSVQPVLPKQEKSNIDLLSGLDFSINQAPLIPQPKKIETPSKEVQAAKPVEQPSQSVAPKIEKVDETVLRKKFQKNSFQDPNLIKEFVQEVDRFEKFVDTLSSKTLNGPTSLEVKWKEIQERQDAEQSQHSISVARCYPMKNRFPDILPFDQTRVKLNGRKHDYINASHIKDVGVNTPEFIVTQSPLNSTYSEFWLMVFDENVELILCLLNDGEIGTDRYWPSQNSSLSVDNFLISVENQYVHEHWTDTELVINQLDVRCVKKVRHIQFRSWPSTLFPPIPVVVKFLNEVLQHPRLFAHPILIHCSAGIGRSGFLCLVLCAAAEIIVNPPAIPDLGKLSMKLSGARKNIIRDQEHFKYAYQVFLNFLKDTIQTNNLSKKVLTGEAVDIQSQLAPSIANEEDPLSLLDPFWASKTKK